MSTERTATSGGDLSRCVFLVAGILLLAGLYACWCGTPLTWDGSYQFGYMLIHQRPYAYGTRLHSWLVWWPVVWVSRWTGNLAVLELTFGLPFILAPVVGLVASWWIVRKDAPGLIVWAIFGIGIAPLPGQIFVINDSIFQQHLFWPVFLGAFVPLTRRQSAALALLALFQLSHPIGVVLLLIAAATAGLAAWREGSRRRARWVRCVALTALTVIAVAKLIAWPDVQAADEFHFLVAQNRWRKGVGGAPLEGLCLFWLAGACHLIRARREWTRRDRARPSRVAHWWVGASLALALAGGAVRLNWAGDEHEWAYALDYRRWLVPLTLPFFVMCGLQAAADRRRVELGATEASPDPALQDEPVVRRHIPTCYVLAAIFAAVLGAQSTLWSLLTRRLLNDVRQYPAAVVPRSALPWIDGTPLQHWSLPMDVALLQGPAPRKVLLYDSSARAALEADPPRIPLDPWEPRPPEPGPVGWFDYRPFLHSNQSDEGATSH